LLKDIGPSVREVTVTQNQRLLPGAPLSRHRFHTIRPRTGHDDHRRRVVRLFQSRVQVFHDFAKRLRHVVHGTVRVHDGVLQKPAGRIQRQRTRVERFRPVVLTSRILRLCLLVFTSRLLSRDDVVARGRQRRPRRRGGSDAGRSDARIFGKRAQSASGGVT